MADLRLIYNPLFERSQWTIRWQLKEGRDFSRDLSADNLPKGVFKKYNPDLPFNYTFNDEDYAKKFAAEQRVGKLATFFTILAIFISCLGLFGLASFVAEQRKKEIGVAKCWVHPPTIYGGCFQRSLQGW